MIRRGRESNAVHVEPLFTFITLYHISVRFWHQAIAEHFNFLVGKVLCLKPCFSSVGNGRSIRERGSVLYLGMATENLNLP